MIDAACDLGLDIISLSFVRNAEDIRVVKKLLKEKNKFDITLFTKVETASAVGKYPVECVKMVFDMYHNSFSA